MKFNRNSSKNPKRMCTIKHKARFSYLMEIPTKINGKWEIKLWKVCKEARGLLYEPLVDSIPHWKWKARDRVDNIQGDPPPPLVPSPLSPSVYNSKVKREVDDLRRWFNVYSDYLTNPIIEAKVDSFASFSSLCRFFFIFKNFLRILQTWMIFLCNGMKK